MSDHPLHAMILAEVILRNYVVWIRTQDGKLYIAPLQSGGGLSWCYSGGGRRHACAILLNRLLNDINACAPGYGIADNERPEGLLAVAEGAPEAGAAYTRDELLKARDRR